MTSWKDNVEPCLISVSIGNGSKSAGTKRELAELIPVQDGFVVGMHQNRGLQGAAQGGHAGDVIDVPVRQQHVLDPQLLRLNLVEHPTNLQAGIDDHSGHGLPAADEITIFAEQLVRENRDLQLLSERLGGSHPATISRDAGLITSGP